MFSPNMTYIFKSNVIYSAELNGYYFLSTYFICFVVQLLTKLDHTFLKITLIYVYLNKGTRKLYFQLKFEYISEHI